MSTEGESQAQAQAQALALAQVLLGLRLGRKVCNGIDADAVSAAADLGAVASASMVAVSNGLLYPGILVGAVAFTSKLQTKVLVSGTILSAFLDGHIRTVEEGTVQHAVGRGIDTAVQESEVADLSNVLVPGGKRGFVDIDATAASAEHSGVSCTRSGAL